MGTLSRGPGSPSPATLRSYLHALAEVGVVVRKAQRAFPGTVEYELTEAGRDLIMVGRALERWLASAPEGPVALGTATAKSLIKAVVDAWSSTMIRALSACPLCLIDLNSLIADLNYPAIERRLRALRLGGLVEAVAAPPRRTPYRPTVWLRLAIAPLAAAARWERKHLPDETPRIGKLDVEAAYLLAVPTLGLVPEVSGRCRLAVEFGAGAEHVPAGVIVEVRGGTVVSCVADLRGRAPAWASGSAPAWLRAVIDGEAAGLEVGGDSRLAAALIGGLHQLT